MVSIKYKDEAKIRFTTGLGVAIGEAIINKEDLDLFRIVGMLSKHTCIFIEEDNYIELNDSHNKIKPCWRRKKSGNFKGQKKGNKKK